MLAKEEIHEDKNYYIKPIGSSQYKFYKKYFFDLPDVVALKENEVICRYYNSTLSVSSPTSIRYAALQYGLELIKKVPLNITMDHVLVHDGDKIGFCGSTTCINPITQLVETVCQRNYESETSILDVTMGLILDEVKKKIYTEKIDAIDLMIFMKYLSKNIFLN